MIYLSDISGREMIYDDFAAISSIIDGFKPANRLQAFFEQILNKIFCLN